MRFVDVSEKIVGIIGSNAIILVIQVNPFQSFYKFLNSIQKLHPHKIVSFATLAPVERFVISPWHGKGASLKGSNFNMHGCQRQSASFPRSIR